LKARQLKALAQCGCISVALVSNRQIKKLNKQWRGKDYATDVLSFPAPEPHNGAIGEIAISWDRARAQASEYGHTAAGEVSILMLHGVLHLLGMDHENDAGQMARAESRWRKRLGLAAGLIERSRK